MFLTGPQVVRDGARRECLDGGARRSRRARRATASASWSPPTSATAPAGRASCSRMLPGAARRAPPRALGARAAARATRRRRCPAEARRVYDVRDVIAALVDGGESLELCAGLGAQHGHRARADRRPPGRRDRQPAVAAGRRHRRRRGREGRALFVDACDRFGLPLVVLVDTPGFMPGRRQEEAGVIRHGASLLRAFAAASVPRLTVVLRKAYGGAVITMNSKELGADMVFAWPRRRDRDHGREPGGRDRRAPAAAPTPNGDGPARRARRRLRRRAPDRRRRRRERLRRRGDRAARRPARRLAWALAALEAR